MSNQEHEHIYLQRSQLKTDCYCTFCGKQIDELEIRLREIQDANKSWR